MSTHALYSLMLTTVQARWHTCFCVFTVCTFHSLLQKRQSGGVFNLWNRRGHVIFQTDQSGAFHNSHSTDFPPDSAFHITIDYQHPLKHAFFHIVVAAGPSTGWMPFLLPFICDCFPTNVIVMCYCL